MYHDTSFMIYITKLYRVAWALIYIGILQTTHRGGGRGGVRLEKGLGYGYSYIVTLISSERSKVKKKKKKKMIRLALSYSYHLPKLLVGEKYYLLNESEQLGILYCVLFSIGYIVHIHIWDKSIVSVFCLFWNRLYNVTHE